MSFSLAKIFTTVDGLNPDEFIKQIREDNIIKYKNILTNLQTLFYKKEKENALIKNNLLKLERCTYDLMQQSIKLVHDNENSVEMSKILDTIPNLIVILDLDFNILFSNIHFKEFVKDNFNITDIKNKNINDIFNKNYELINDNTNELIVDDRTIKYNVNALYKLNNSDVLYTSTNPLKNKDNKYIGFVRIYTHSLSC